MGKYKKETKYNIVSLRVTDDERAAIDKMKRNTRKSISMLMREAMHQYTSLIGGSSSR